MGSVCTGEEGVAGMDIQDVSPSSLLVSSVLQTGISGLFAEKGRVDATHSCDLPIRVLVNRHGVRNGRLRTFWSLRTRRRHIQKYIHNVDTRTFLFQCCSRQTVPNCPGPALTVLSWSTLTDNPGHPISANRTVRPSSAAGWTAWPHRLGSRAVSSSLRSYRPNRWAVGGGQEFPRSFLRAQPYPWQASRCSLRAEQRRRAFRPQCGHATGLEAVATPLHRPHVDPQIEGTDRSAHADPAPGTLVHSQYSVPSTTRRQLAIYGPRRPISPSFSRWRSGHLVHRRLKSE